MEIDNLKVLNHRSEPAVEDLFMGVQVVGKQCPGLTVRGGVNVKDQITAAVFIYIACRKILNMRIMPAAVIVVVKAADRYKAVYGVHAGVKKPDPAVIFGRIVQTKANPLLRG